MRIVTGKYKGRRFDVPRTFKARPTTDFAKENIFNVLQGHIDFDDAMALDLFAGTGSISLELMSRGCRQVISVEADRDHAAFIRQCAQKLNDDSLALIRGDVFRFLKSCRQQFDFIFADPPYALKELASIPDIIVPAVHLLWLYRAFFRQILQPFRLVQSMGISLFRRNGRLMLMFRLWLLRVRSIILF